MNDPLAAALAENLDRAFEGLVRAHQDRLYSLALRYSGSPSDAEELVQDAFVRAFRALERYERERVRALDLRPWLTTILLNLCRNLAARAARRPSQAQPDPDLPDDRADSPARRAERREGVERWAALVASLPAVYRAAVLLRHLEGMSYAEIAQVLNRPEGTIKAQVHRGISLLRAAFEADERRRPDIETRVGAGSPASPSQPALRLHRSTPVEALP